MKTISYSQIEDINYDILDLLGIKDDFEMSVVDFINKYKDVPENRCDILTLLLRLEFMSIKEMRLFALSQAKEFIKVAKINDSIAITACNTIEKYANEFRCPTNEDLKDAKNKVYKIDGNYTYNPIYWACSDSPSIAAIKSASSLVDYLATKKDPSRGGKWIVKYDKVRSEQLDGVIAILNEIAVCLVRE